ncbi:MAG: phosphoglucosamine mutase [Candidatus Nanopelagicales bacterium]
MARIFGTDGVRGLANRDITAELALNLASSVARVLGRDAFEHGKRPRAVVGYDSRISGQFLESAVCAGLAAAGVDVYRLGVLPTPGVAFLVGSLDADFGVMLSASHNPMPDNGIKFFAAGGHKLPDEVEDLIEAGLDQQWELPVGAEVGRIEDYENASGEYVDHLVAAVPSSLQGISLVVDCANGAASTVAPEAYAKAGAHVVPINAEPDGININENAGSTHIDLLAEIVRDMDVDLGLAHDGDADRCLAVDAQGNVVDGDQILAILAIDLKERGELPQNTVVSTVMSNLGFKNAMRASGIDVVQTAVGDRYVLESMRENGFGLGGEQSGHVILSKHATTGDGVLTGLLLAARMASSGESLADLGAVVVRLPQVLVNVGNVDRNAVAINRAVQSAVESAAAELGDSGRVLLRPSGTEPLVRVMVEAPTEEQADEIANRLAEVVKAELSLG